MFALPYRNLSIKTENTICAYYLIILSNTLSSDLTHLSLSVERDKQVFVKFCGEF